MNKVTTIILVFICTLGFAGWSALAAETKLVEYVHPLIGTGAADKNSLSGENFPGATTPFGLVQLSPDTGDVPCNSGYNYNDKAIFGFSHTHLSGTGVGDLYDIL